MKSYTNRHVTVTAECSLHLLRQTWAGVPSSPHYREGSRVSMRLAERHQLKRWLIDLRQLRLFNPLDLQWFAQEWLPEAALRLPESVRVAIILNGPHQFGKLGSDLMLRASLRINKALTSRYFLDEDEARQWLMTDA